MSNNFDRAITLHELCKATKECKRNVSWKDSVSGYVNHKLLRNKRLRDEIIFGKYHISPYVKFTIYEPKKRDILATRIRDRVFQRSMANNGVVDDMSRSFIYDNGACIKGKGTDHTIERTKCFLSKFYRRYGDNCGYAVHLDIHKYFPSTPHKVAKAVIEERITDKAFISYLFAIIDSFEDEQKNKELNSDCFGLRGIGLGSQMSQLIQLSIPDKIDHMIKEKYEIPFYIRYMDDFLMISRDVESLQTAIEFITDALAEIGLKVTNKGGIFPLCQGIKFLKLRFILTDTGRVIVRLSHRTLTKERKQLRNMKVLLDRRKIIMKDVENHYQSWIAHVKRADSYGVIKKMDNYYFELFKHKPNWKYKKRRNKNGY